MTDAICRYGVPLEKGPDKILESLVPDMAERALVRLFACAVKYDGNVAQASSMAKDFVTVLDAIRERPIR